LAISALASTLLDEAHGIQHIELLCGRLPAAIFALIEPIFDLLSSRSPEQSIYQALLPEELQAREFLQDWLKDETVIRVLARLASSTPILIGSSPLS